MKNHIALQLYSVRKDAQTDLYGTLKKIKKMGYSGVEFAGLYGHDPLIIKQMCEEVGLIPVAAHIPFKSLIESIDENIVTSKALGVRYVVIPFLTEEYRLGSGKFQVVIDEARRLGEKFAEAGIILQYHNHDFELEKISGDCALDILYREVPPQYLQTQLDTCWIKYAGEEPVEYLRKYAGRIPTIHLKDFVGEKSNAHGLTGMDEKVKSDHKKTFDFRPIGMGVQDFRSIITTAIEGGTEWFIVEQDHECMGLKPLECAEVSVRFLLNKLFE